MNQYLIILDREIFNSNKKIEELKDLILQEEAKLKAFQLIRRKYDESISELRQPIKVNVINPFRNEISSDNIVSLIRDRELRVSEIASLFGEDRDSKRKVYTYVHRLEKQ